MSCRTMGSNTATEGKPILRKLIYPLALLLLNLALVRGLFQSEYIPNLGSTEGTFVELTRYLSAHPTGIFAWWPYWECGLPFQNTYLPLFAIAAGWWAHLTGAAAGLAVHQVGAAFYALGPVFVYWMAWRITGRAHASFLAAAAYSLLAPCVWFVPEIRHDTGSLWNLRRLQTLGYYGEDPLTCSMAALPLAILALYKAIQKGRVWRWVLAALAMAATLLFNAFGAVILGVVGLSLLGGLARPGRVFWPLVAAGALTYAWVSPLLPPSVLAAIRMNSPTVDADYRFTSRSFVGVVILAAGFFAVRWAVRKLPSDAMRVMGLFTFLTSGVVLLGTLARVYVVPQPHRYQLAMDLGWCFLLAFAAAALLRTRPVSWRVAAGALAAVGLAAAFVNNVRYADRLIQPIDITTTGTYRAAQWIDSNLDGRRVMMPGSYSYWLNNFSDTPQLLGGHDPMLPNWVMRIAGYVLYSDDGAGDRAGEISIAWLKALGTHAVLVPGPESSEVYKPFAHPTKFDGLLPVLWQESGDTIYEVPARSPSLAHVIPSAAVVEHQPVNGLDLTEIDPYVAALDDPGLPEAQLSWRDLNTAAISAPLSPGQVLSVQVTYHQGWHATANGAPVPVTSDGLGLLVLAPSCDGPCEVTLAFDGGLERRLTVTASLLTMLLAIGLLLRDLRRKPA